MIIIVSTVWLHLAKLQRCVEFVVSSGIADCFTVLCLHSDCVPECVHGQCNMSLGVCQCIDGYIGVDCSSIGRYVAIITFY